MGRSATSETEVVVKLHLDTNKPAGDATAAARRRDPTKATAPKEPKPKGKGGRPKGAKDSKPRKKRSDAGQTKAIEWTFNHFCKKPLLAVFQHLPLSFLQDLADK